MKSIIKFLTILAMFTAGALAVSRPTSAMDDDWSEKSSSEEPKSKICEAINKQPEINNEKKLKQKSKIEEHIEQVKKNMGEKMFRSNKN